MSERSDVCLPGLVGHACLRLSVGVGVERETCETRTASPFVHVCVCECTCESLVSVYNRLSSHRCANEAAAAGPTTP